MRIITPTMKLTDHFSADEWTSDREKVPYPLNKVDELDPTQLWVESRLIPLAQLLEVVRFECGGKPINLTPNGGYRTESHQEALKKLHPRDALVASASGSQHPKGRAADIQHTILSPQELHRRILDLYRRGRLPRLGGLGLYPKFVHVDVRPRQAGDRIAQWRGERKDNVA